MKKNVHAYVVCTEYEFPYLLIRYDDTARYNPYKSQYFYDQYGEMIHRNKAKLVNLHEDGTVSYAYK